MWTIFHTEASLGWGGQEIRILNESLGMRDRGHRVLIFAEKESTLIKKAAQCGFETKPLSFQKKHYLATLLKVLRLIKELKPDFINTHSSKDSWIVSIASRLSSHKLLLIRTRHLSTPVATNIAGSIIYKFLPHMIITTGEAIREQLIERNHVLPDKIISIPTGIDLDVFDPKNNYKDIRQELSLPDQTPLIGMVSVLRSWKGHDYFIEAAELTSKELPQARFLIVGDGPRYSAIKKLIEYKGLNRTVFMLGHREDVPAILSSLDILVQPSYANEGVPQSVVQGMAMALPIIASDLRPLAEVVKNGETGLIVPAKDSKKLAERIIMLINDKELRARLGKNGRTLVLEKFSIERMIDSIEAAYDSIISRYSKPEGGDAMGINRDDLSKKPDDYDFDKTYSSNYSMTQTRKFLLRKIRINDICHWHDRIKLFCDEIIERLDLHDNAKYLDLGCNIGTFAIELASRGKQAIGVDLSQEALNYAKVLSNHIGIENKPEFVKGDISVCETFHPESFDVIMAEDIFEHLHEDLLKKTFRNCALWLKPGGYLIYHTHPTKYDYLFHSRGWKSILALLPLIPFLVHGERKFKRTVELYHKYVMNPISKLRYGKTQEERISHKAHCNLLTTDYVEDLIQSVNLISLTVKTANLYKREKEWAREIFFGKREYFHRNIYGIAWKPLAEFK